MRAGGAGVAIGLVGLAKAYPGGGRALGGIDLEVAAGEYLVVLGPSGSGKTTLLRLVAGLEDASAGSIRLDGRDVTDRPPRFRDVAMVFQNPALFPHLTVARNLAFGLRERGLDRATIQARVAEAAALLDLSDLLDRKPGTLSGGQRQRVALGRVMARRPAVCLLDEPMAALDVPLRAAVRDHLRALREATGATFLHVTHDQSEALAMADRLAILEAGRLAQVGPPRHLYERPADRFVATFLGSPPMNLLPWEPGHVLLGVRPEHVTLAPPDAPRDPGLRWLPNALTVRAIVDQGDCWIVTLTDETRRLDAKLSQPPWMSVGAPSLVGLDLRRASWFDGGTGRAVDPMM